jgi:hypothetical protein
MAIDELPINIHFFPKEPQEDEIESYNDNYNKEDPNGLNFRKICSDVVRRHFDDGWNTMKPLLNDKKIKSIEIIIDLIGVKDTSTIVAFVPPLSTHAGDMDFTVGFYVNKYLLEVYLKDYWDKNFELKIFYKSVWHHELIHFLNYNYKNDLDYYNFQNSRIRGKLVLNHLLRFRVEGVADLYYTLKNHGAIKDMVSARKGFRDEINRIVNLPWQYLADLKELISSLRSTYSYYDLGPWMVLHALSCPDNSDRFPQVNEIMKHISVGDVIDDQEVFPIIRKALQLDNYTFLKFLLVPWTDGLPFIDQNGMNLLTKATGKILSRSTAPVSGDIDHPQEIPTINKIIDFYNQFIIINNI